MHTIQEFQSVTKLGVMFIHFIYLISCMLLGHFLKAS
jgi:hypothetical protein